MSTTIHRRPAAAGGETMPTSIAGILAALSAVILGAFGLLLMFDQLSRVTSELTKALDAVGLRNLVTLG